MTVFFWALVSIIVVVQLLIFASSFRAQREQAATLPLRKRITEVFWTVAPALVLVILLALTWRSLSAP